MGDNNFYFFLRSEWKYCAIQQHAIVKTFDICDLTSGSISHIETRGNVKNGHLLLNYRRTHIAESKIIIREIERKVITPQLCQLRRHTVEHSGTVSTPVVPLQRVRRKNKTHTFVLQESPPQMSTHPNFRTAIHIIRTRHRRSRVDATFLDTMREQCMQYATADSVHLQNPDLLNDAWDLSTLDVDVYLNVLKVAQTRTTAI